MSLTFPRTDILDGLTFSPDTPPFKPLWRQESSRDANGKSFVKDMGPLLWQAFYHTTPLDRSVAAQLEADLLSLGGGIETFEGYDPRHCTPASDPGESANLDEVSVKLIKGDLSAIQLQGLPNGFVVTKGDMLSIDDGTNLNLHKIVETITAYSTGNTVYFEVRPPIRVSVAIDDPVTLRYAPARFMIDKDSVKRSPISAFLETISFSALQVIE
jgi:hypothetical protein